MMAAILCIIIVKHDYHTTTVEFCRAPKLLGDNCGWLPTITARSGPSVTVPTLNTHKCGSTKKQLDLKKCLAFQWQQVNSPAGNSYDPIHV